MVSRLKDLRIIISALICILVVALAVIRYPTYDSVNYLNSDATWHTLLTIEAYNETPIAQHLFLPIVSLGEETDKWISWGATIPDAKGNYYYTSFSPAGYFLPWLFIKIFGLSVSESSLYVFNTFLMMLSAVLWYIFLSWIYRESEPICAQTVPVIGVILYIAAPEILHGMGIVYWHQSIMQVTLLLQMMMWYLCRYRGSRGGRIAFYILVILNPYIEWTGYVANVGFALAELMAEWGKNITRGLCTALKIGGGTVLSFILFAGHYLLRVDSTAFFNALMNRFIARNYTTDILLPEMFGGYFKSFLYIWIVLLVLIIWSIARDHRLEFPNGLLMLVMSFPLLENVIMKEHALYYTYDRMKGIYILVFVCCELASQIIHGYLGEKKQGVWKGIQIQTDLTLRIGRLNFDSISSYGVRRACTVLLMMFFAITGSLLNYSSYYGNTNYVWVVDYRNDNELLADYINGNYESSLLVTNGFVVRGYLNMLFGRGILEWYDYDTGSLIDYACEKGMDYAIILDQNTGVWNMYQISQATVYDLNNGDVSYVYVENGAVYVDIAQ